MTYQEIIEDIKALQRGIVPKNDISDILLYHKCDYLLSKIRNRTYGNHLMLDNVINRVAIKERYHACENVFNQINFPYAIIKGAVLSNTIYHDPFVRSSGDIDILVCRKDIEHLKKILDNIGFIQGRATKYGIKPFTRKEILFQSTYSHQIAPFIKETKNNLCPFINLDVNIDILWGEYSEQTDMNYVLSCVEPYNLFDITFYKLSPEMEFVSLCLHHYKDLNSLYLLTVKGLRLGLYCEIYDYICKVHLDLIKLRGIIQKLHVGRYIYVCLHQVREIFDDIYIDKYLNLLSDYMDVQLCDSFGLNENERKKWDIPLLDRLFCNNIAKYVESKLSDEEKEKVNINKRLM